MCLAQVQLETSSNDWPPKALWSIELCTEVDFQGWGSEASTNIAVKLKHCISQKYLVYRASEQALGLTEEYNAPEARWSFRMPMALETKSRICQGSGGSQLFLQHMVCHAS